MTCDKCKEIVPYLIEVQQERNPLLPYDGRPTRFTEKWCFLCIKEGTVP